MIHLEVIKFLIISYFITVQICVWWVFFSAFDGLFYPLDPDPGTQIVADKRVRILNMHLFVFQQISELFTVSHISAKQFLFCLTFRFSKRIFVLHKTFFNENHYNERTKFVNFRSKFKVFSTSFSFNFRS